MLINLEQTFESMLAACKPISTEYTSHVSGNLILNFSYNELRENGDFIVLNSDEKFLQTLIENDVCLDMPKSILNAHPTVGFYVLDWDDNVSKDTFKPFIHICQKFDFGHTLRFVQVSSDPKYGLVIKRFGLESALNNNEANHFYLNHLPLIKDFFIEMDAHISTIKEQVIPLKSELNQTLIRKYIAFNERHNPAPISLKKSTVEPQKVTPEIGNIYLTKREMDALEWLQKGKTADETAIILGLSRRTVECHIDKLRKKFNCHSKHMILKKLDLLNK